MPARRAARPSGRAAAHACCRTLEVDGRPARVWIEGLPGTDTGAACSSTSWPAADPVARALGWAHVRSLCLFAASPRTSSRSSRSSRAASPRPWRPTTTSRRPRRSTPSSSGRPPGSPHGAAAAPAAGAHLGTGPVVGQGPLDRQPDDQRPDGDGRREARLPRASPRAAACCRPTATSSGTPPTQTNARGKPLKQPFFIRPTDGGILAMAGLYEIWRDPTKAEDDPDRFRWTCTVLTTEAEDSLGHIHDRMPLMVERDRWDAWLDPTMPGDTSLARPGRAGPARGLPRVDAGEQRPQQRPRAGRADPARGGRGEEGDRPHRSTRRTARVGSHTRRATSRWRRCCSATAPAAASRPATSRALADALPAQGITVVLFEQPWRVAGRKVATAPPTLDAGLTRAADLLRMRRRWSWAAARPEPGRPPVGAGARRGRVAWRCPSRCTRPGRPRRPGSPSCAGPGCRPWWSRASATRWAGPRSSPATSPTSTWRRPGRRPRAQGAGAGRRQPGRGDGDHRRVDARMAGPRDRRESTTG